MKTKFYTLQILLAAVLGLSACGNSTGEADASGTFEATEVIVSAEAAGRILSFNVEEGQSYTAGQQLGSIDSTQTYLKLKQLESGQKALNSRRPDIHTQIATIEQQIATAQVEQKRAENLVKANAGNQKMLDDVRAQIALLQKQLDAQKTALENTDKGMTQDNEGLSYQARQLKDQLEKCRIVSPIHGTVLVKYAEAGELAMPGKALFKIADTDHMILRAYITNAQMAQVKVGQKVKVSIVFGDQSKKYDGTISWISGKAEFTPKTIQTQDERANLVYAVKINVNNDGYLKIGMYGDVKL